MSSYCFFLVTLATVCLSFVSGDEIGNNALKANLNKLIDLNIDHIRNELSNADSISLPNFDALRDYYHLTKGVVSKLSNVHRADNSTIKYDDRKLSIDMRFGWDDIKITYNVAWIAWHITDCEQVYSAQFSDLKAKVSVEVDLKNYKASLKSFNLYNLVNLRGGITSTFMCKTNHEEFDKITALIITTMENKFTKAINKRIDKVNQIISRDF